MTRKRFANFGGTLKVTMKARLIAGFTVMVLVFAGAALFQSRMQSEIGGQIALQNGEVAKQQLAMRLKQEVQELAVIHAGLVVTRSDGQAARYGEIEASFAGHVRQIGETASSPEQRRWSATLNTVSGEFTATFHAALDTLRSAPADQVGRLLDQQFSASQVHKDYIFEQIDLFNDSYSAAALAAMAKSDELFARARSVAVYATSIALLSAIAIAVLLIRSFLAPIRRMQQAMGLIGQGDLCLRIDSRARDELGELGASFDRMMDNVSDMLVRMRGIGVELNDRSADFRSFSRSTAAANADILQAIGEIASGADQQAALTERSAELASALGREVKEIARSADEMKRLSHTTDEQTRVGTETVGELNDAAKLAGSLLQSAESAVESFVRDAAQIGKMVHAISEIAVQTNILSLNASIEAARAGQHGKGFIVIADEVRQLSDQSKASAKQIAALLASVQSHITEVRTQMGAAGEAARRQGSKVRETLAAFGTIQGAIAELRDQTDTIHAKVKRAEAEQDELIDAIHNVAAIAEQTAAGVQEVNSTSIAQNDSVRRIAGQADALHGLAESLFVEIGRFKTPDRDEDRDERAAAGAEARGEVGLAEQLPAADGERDAPGEEAEDVRRDDSPSAIAASESGGRHGETPALEAQEEVPEERKETREEQKQLVSV